MTKDEALQMCLEYIETDAHERKYVRHAIKAALEAKDEPVKIIAYNCKCGRTMKFESEHGIVAPQRTWVGLTDEEVKQLCLAVGTEPMEVRLIEAKLKEKNNA